MKTKKPFKYNSKSTKIRCIKCRTIFISHRDDTKTCSDLCRVQERIERKEKGYIYNVLHGNQKDLDVFLNKIIDLKGIPFFSNVSYEIRAAIKVNDNSDSWKLESKGFRSNHRS